MEELLPRINIFASRVVRSGVQNKKQATSERERDVPLKIGTQNSETVSNDRLELFFPLKKQQHRNLVMSVAKIPGFPNLRRLSRGQASAPFFKKEE